MNIIIFVWGVSPMLIVHRTHPIKQYILRMLLIVRLVCLLGEGPLRRLVAAFLSARTPMVRVPAIHVHICMCVYIYIYIYRERDMAIYLCV